MVCLIPITNLKPSKTGVFEDTLSGREVPLLRIFHPPLLGKKVIVSRPQSAQARHTDTRGHTSSISGLNRQHNSPWKLPAYAEAAWRDGVQRFLSGGSALAGLVWPVCQERFAFQGKVYFQAEEQHGKRRGVAGCDAYRTLASAAE